MTPIEHEEHLGYARFVERVEGAEDDILVAEQLVARDAVEKWCDAAIEQLDEAIKLVDDEGPRGVGASKADYHRWARGLPTAADLRERANAILYGAVEASAITGGHIEELRA